MTAPVVAAHASLSELYKTRYRSTGAEKKALMARHTLYGKMKRSKDLTGKIIAWPIQYDDATGYVRGTNGLALLADTTHSPIGPNKYSQWNVQLEVEYAAHWFDNITKMQMKDDKGAYKRLMESEMQALKERFAKSLGHGIYRDGTGVTGTIASASLTLGVGTITLSKKTDTKYFSKGQKLNAINPASPALPAGGDYTTSYFEVTKRNLAAGTIDVLRVGTTAVDTATTGWFLSPIGWYVQGGTGRIKGLAAICPSTDPGPPDSFYNVNRSVDPNTLAGWRFPGASTVAMEDQIVEMSVLMGGNGAPGSLWVMANPIQVQKVLNRAQGRLQYETESVQDGEYAYGYRYVTIATTEGDVRVYSDPDCPEDVWYGMNEDSLSLGTLGDEPEVITVDGVTHTRRGAIDGTELQLRVLAQVMPDNTRTIVTGSLS